MEETIKIEDEPSGPYVFISYSHVDSHLADQIANDLESLAIDYFLDRKDIGWGQSISEGVRSALRKCTHQIILLSPASIKSEWVHFEVGHAVGSGKIALPFLTHPSLDMPQYLKDFLWIGNRDDLRKYFENERRQIARPSLMSVELVNHAGALANQGRYHDALRYCLWAIERDVMYDLGYVFAISNLRRVGRYDEGLDVAAKGLSLLPNNPLIMMEKAFVLRSLGRLQQAVEVFAEILEIDPEYLEAHYYYGDCLQKLGLPKEAIKEYQIALTLAPSSNTIKKWARQRIHALKSSYGADPLPPAA